MGGRSSYLYGYMWSDDHQEDAWVEEPPLDRCGYTCPDDHGENDWLYGRPRRQVCCWRESVDGLGRCIWHADPDEVTKSIEAIREACASEGVREQISPVGELLVGAKLSGVEPDDRISFRHASLRECNISDTSLEDADFFAANLSGAFLWDADLSEANLRRADLYGATLWDTDLSEADLRYVDLFRANLRGADLSGANLRGANLSRAILAEANLSGAILAEADLSGANLLDADLPNASLLNSDLSGAYLRGTDLTDANLQDADLPGTNLWDADLSRAEFRGTDLSGAAPLNANLSGTVLRGIDLTDADLFSADLTDTDLRRVDLSGGNLRCADLSGADLRHTDLSGADLQHTDLSGADLRYADLSGADLQHTDLSSADLQHTDLLNADLRKATIDDVSVNGATTCKYLHDALDFDAEDWAETASAYHALKTTFNDQGLIDKARNMHVRERRVRSLEAKAKSGWRNSGYWASVPFWIFTGYGVRIRNLLIWMLLLFVIPTLVYAHTGVEETFLKNVSYSVLAFTVAPPHIPPEPLVQAIMMVQTFLGTLSIVLLGYILGNRERF